MPALDAHVQDAVDAWMEALERRHLQDLTFQEVARALRALSSCYVERRHRLTTGQALEGAGKRAAFALFYAPIHFILTAFIVRALALDVPEGGSVVDVGCGTGAAGAAWAVTGGGVPLFGIDRNAWAVREAEWTWRTLRLHGRAVHGDLDRLRLPRGRHGIVAAFTVNELPPPARTRFRDRLLDAASHGDAVLVVEPLARASAPWWDEWAESFGNVGGEEQTWRAALALP